MAQETRTKLTDAQRALLCQAAQRDDRSVSAVLNPKVKGAALGKMLASLARHGMVETRDAKPTEPGAQPVGDNAYEVLLATPAAFERLGIDPAEWPQSIQPKDEPAPAPLKKAAATTQFNKAEQVVAMLRRPRGATSAQIEEAMGWDDRNVRRTISATLRQKMGLKVICEKVTGERAGYYKIVD